jgi:hypothetical protein
MNSFENFAEDYNKEKMLQLELEKIEIVSLKMEKEYKDYQELVSFIDYLRSSEQIFVMSRAYRWTGEKLKEELIKKELHVSALNSGINEEVFHAIYGEFKNLSANVGKIYQAAEELLAKHKDCLACCEFINYLRDITILFIEVEKEKVGFDEAKDRIFKIKMKALSATGTVELGKFEKIYEEFKNNLK